MPAIRNEHGIVMDVDDDGIDHAKARGVLDLWKIYPYVDEGTGPERRLCMLMQDNGIGDDVHALPAMMEKARTHELIVYTRPFRIALWQRLGFDARDGNALGIGFVEQNLRHYGGIYSLSQWCLRHDWETKGDVSVDRFDQFAKYIRTKAPTQFDFRAALIPDEFSKEPEPEHILFAPLSTSMQRTYPYRELLFQWLKDRYGSQYETLMIAPEKEGGVYADDWRQLVWMVLASRLVITVDNGILALALALGRPVVALFGPTEPSIIVDQFRRYVPEIYSTVIRPGTTFEQCTLPCNFQRARGFAVGGWCDNGYSECIRSIAFETVTQEVERMV